MLNKEGGKERIKSDSNILEAYPKIYETEGETANGTKILEKYLYLSNI